MNFKPEERRLIGEVVIICKLLHVNPATSASAERSFSMARRLKTWLRSNMKQARFNNLAIQNFHKKRAGPPRGGGSRGNCPGARAPPGARKN